jgi:hypothetical protein
VFSFIAGTASGADIYQRGYCPGVLAILKTRGKIQGITDNGQVSMPRENLLAGNNTLNAVTVYEVKNGEISKVSFIRQDCPEMTKELVY